MAWLFKSDRPIYTQLLEQIQLYIVSGIYPPGDKLPSVRDLASEASVNPNTMQKALSELERSGLIYSQRTTGRYVTEDINMIKEVKENLAVEKITEFFLQMKELGFQPQETIELVQKSIKELQQ